jgi:hypothetical protein
MKNFFTKAAFCYFLFFQLVSCSKAPGTIKENGDPVPGSYTHYIISQGQHYSQQSTYTPTEYTELRFLVKFDSTAVYTTASAENQYDINKLYGFADNGEQHHEFSARIGWRWSDGVLSLFGYTYNNGEMSYEELSVIRIGEEYECSIKVTEHTYIFSANSRTITMSRTSEGVVAKGYKLFPYFGGDETAPHDIHIWIKEK